MKKVIILSSFVFLLTSTIVSAQGYDLLQPLPGVGGNSDLPGLLSGIINIVIAIGVLLAVIMLGVGGFQYMMTDAVTTKESAKKTITQAVVGLLILVGSYLILFIINPTIVTTGTDFLSGADTPTSYKTALNETRTGGSSSEETYELTTVTIENDTRGSGNRWEKENCDAQKTRAVRKSGSSVKIGVTNTTPKDGNCPYFTNAPTCSYTVTCVKK